MKPWTNAVSMLFLVTILTNCTRIEAGLPQNWRLPSRLESNDAWRDEDSNKYLRAKGDFNGDGILDTAMLSISEDGASLGLVAFVSQTNKKFKTYFLHETKDNRLIHVMGIKQVPPGTYTTACGKGYWTCSKDEVPTIQLRHDAINYFKIESTNSFFYWDDQSDTFQRIWISD